MTRSEKIKALRDEVAKKMAEIKALECNKIFGCGGLASYEHSETWKKIRVLARSMKTPDVEWMNIRFASVLSVKENYSILPLLDELIADLSDLRQKISDEEG